MTIGQDHRLDDAKENEGSGRRTREGSTHGVRGHGRRVYEGTVRAEQETRPRPRPRKTGDEDGGAEVAPENDAPLTPHPKRPRNGHQTRESRAKHTQPKKCRIKDEESNEKRARFAKTEPFSCSTDQMSSTMGPLRENRAIAPQEQCRTSRIPSASAPKVKHCGHA